jgi:hypothetical protein
MASVDGTNRHPLYREVNKRIREVSESLGSDGALEFLCECAGDDCTATLTLTRVQFDALLTQDDCVVVATDHAHALAGRRVLAENGRFLLVASA